MYGYVADAILRVLGWFCVPRNALDRVSFFPFEPFRMKSWILSRGRSFGDVEAEAGSRESRTGVQVASRGEFSWATWATKAAKIEVEESRLTD
jgi:hypothetical protein